MAEDNTSPESPGRRQAIVKMATGGMRVAAGLMPLPLNAIAALDYEQNSYSYVAAQKLISDRTAQYVSKQLDLPEGVVRGVGELYGQRFIEETEKAVQAGEISGRDKKDALGRAGMVLGSLLAASLATLGAQSVHQGIKELAENRNGTSSQLLIEGDTTPEARSREEATWNINTGTIGMAAAPSAPFIGYYTGLGHAQDSYSYAEAQNLISDRTAQYVSEQVGMPKEMVHVVGEAYGQRFIEETGKAVKAGDIKRIDQKDLPENIGLVVGSLFAASMAIVGAQTFYQGGKDWAESVKPPGNTPVNNRSV